MCARVFGLHAAMIAADRYEEMVGTVIKKNRWNNRKRWISTRNSSFLWETMGIRLCCGLLLDPPSNIYLLYGKVAFRTRSNRFYSRSMRFSKRRPIELFRLKNARRTRIITLLNAIAFLSIIDRINRSCESRKYEQSSTSLPPPSPLRSSPSKKYLRHDPRMIRHDHAPDLSNDLP